MATGVGSGFEPTMPKAKKTWNARSCLDDHATVFASLPNILMSYVGPRSIAPNLNESIMVAVNSANQCPVSHFWRVPNPMLLHKFFRHVHPKVCIFLKWGLSFVQYCEGLHGELARMAGVDSAKLQKAKNVQECTAVVDDVAISFARTFAECNGSGQTVDRVFQGVVAKHGNAAESVRALCWFLHWGSVGGNTLNSVLFEGSRGPFELLFALYYAPLFVSPFSSSRD